MDLCGGREGAVFPASQPINHPARCPANHPVNPPTGCSANHPATTTHTNTGYPAGHSANPHIGCSAVHSVNPHTGCSTDRPTNPHTGRSTDRPVTRPTKKRKKSTFPPSKEKMPSALKSHFPLSHYRPSPAVTPPPSSAQKFSHSSQDSAKFPPQFQPPRAISIQAPHHTREAAPQEPQTAS